MSFVEINMSSQVMTYNALERVITGFPVNMPLHIRGLHVTYAEGRSISAIREGGATILYEGCCFYDEDVPGENHYKSMMPELRTSKYAIWYKPEGRFCQTKVDNGWKDILPVNTYQEALRALKDWNPQNEYEIRRYPSGEPEKEEPFVGAVDIYGRVKMDYEAVNGPVKKYGIWWKTWNEWARTTLDSGDRVDIPASDYETAVQKLRFGFAGCDEYEIREYPSGEPVQPLPSDPESACRYESKPNDPPALWELVYQEKHDRAFSAEEARVKIAEMKIRATIDPASLVPNGYVFRASKPFNCYGCGKPGVQATEAPAWCGDCGKKNDNR